MKIILFLILISGITLIYFEVVTVKKNENEKINSSSQVKAEIKSRSLKELQDVFLSIDVNSKNLDLDRAIKAIKQAREQYPLDDKLKTVDMELEHRRANKANEATKNSTPNNKPVKVFFN